MYLVWAGAAGLIVSLAVSVPAWVRDLGYALVGLGATWMIVVVVVWAARRRRNGGSGGNPG